LKGKGGKFMWGRRFSTPDKGKREGDEKWKLSTRGGEKNLGRGKCRPPAN